MTQTTALENTSTFMTDAPFWTDRLNEKTFSEMQNGRLEKADQILKQMLSVNEERTIENTLVPYNEILILLDSIAAQSSLMQNVHPAEEFRTTSEKLSQKVSAFGSELSLNRDVFDAISAVDLTDADEITKYYVDKVLRDFRLAGVDKDLETREKIKALKEEIVLIGQEFSRNIRNSKREVIIEDTSELEGLPQDFIENHQPDENGKITLTTDYPDAVPVMSYAKSGKLRKDMYFEFNNRAYPENIDVLEKLAAKRFELANLLGFENYADYVTADKMIKSGSNASEFITKIVEAAKARGKAEYQELLERKRKDTPSAEAVNRWESTYYTELVSKENYSFDSQSIRPYYQYNKVKNGALDVTSRLFGVSFKQRKDVPVWHEAVECWEMFEDGKLVGRFYLDMHPREGKYSHAAQFDIRTGIPERQIPEATLVCNFPEETDDNPGLMEQGDVETFFHEFGHLLHTLFAKHSKWVQLGGISTEWDFVEAPSQMLEEWAKDAKTLQTFAKHYETGEPIPTDLVDQMNRASEFGKGLYVLRQMEYARLSLSIYDRKPEKVDTDKLIKEIAQDYSPFPFVEDTHMQAAFGHLNGYSAIYYTYMWSLVLAKDLFSEFDRSNMFNQDIARKYRQNVLNPGSTKPAEKLVESFLGRKSNFEAYQYWLNSEVAEA